jgi:hypothetical protein
MKIVSQKQAAFLGRVAGGKKPRGGKGPSKAKARRMLSENKGLRLSSLPERAPSRRRPSRTARRSNYRSGRR